MKINRATQPLQEVASSPGAWVASKTKVLGVISRSEVKWSTVVEERSSGGITTQIICNYGPDILVCAVNMTLAASADIKLLYYIYNPLITYD